MSCQIVWQQKILINQGPAVVARSCRGEGDLGAQCTYTDQYQSGVAAPFCPTLDGRGRDSNLV